jgi:hypothetical protein
MISNFLLAAPMLFNYRDDRRVSLRNVPGLSIGYLLERNVKEQSMPVRL